MEPRKTVNDCAINYKYNDILHSSKVCSITLIRCDDQLFHPIIKQENICDQVLDGIIKREIVDETDHNNDSQLFQTGTICLTEENEKIIETKIKFEKDFIDINEFQGTIFKENHSSELITSINSDKRSNFKEKPLTCNVCRKEFSNTYKFKFHKNCHPGHNHHRRNTCKVSFNSKELFTRRVSSHDTNKREKLLICDICNESYNNKMHLKKHLMLHTLYLRTHTGENPYKCDICDKSFSQSSALKTHQRTHTGEKSQKCDVCNKRFSTGTDLTKHKRTHTGEKPYEYYICDKTFSRADTLKIQVRSHTGENPYKCDICDKSFSQSSALKTHQRTHTGEKSQKCDVCNKRFSTGTDLTKHKRTHTGEKPYEYYICDKTFSRADTLKIHVRTHTGENPYKCDICDKPFSRADTLKTHVRTHSQIFK